MTRRLRLTTRYPAQLLIVGVILLLIVGTLGLLSPAAHRGPLSWVDALLLATSAVATTGLSSVNVAEVLTPAGQLWLTLLIELGALALLVLGFGFVGLGRQGLVGRLGISADLGMGAGQDFRGLIRRVVLLTLGIQFAGVVLLLPNMVQLEGLVRGLRYALMHAVMAFGNAGFGMWPDGAARLNAFSLFIIMALVVLGGTGFVALDEIERHLRGRFERRLRPPPLSIQTRVALKMTAALLVGGAVLFVVLEWQRPGTLGLLPIPDKLLQATFQSTVSRSAGFATLDYGKFSEPTLLLIMALMFVGGSPGSTAGGIKTTTAAVLLAATRAVLRQERDPHLAGRRIPPATLMRALTVVTLALLAVVTGTLALMFTDSAQPSLALAFEALSAFTTSGLSVNLTPHLSPVGKLVLVVLMFLGRVGFLSLLLAFRPARSLAVQLPETHELTVG
ncbi:potassium transporter TrkH [Deinococcus psychrotolerans]|uniref:Potassium transporter TrkH n=1 Tax=Deinococcus psychrotolerans TaxID=2489213 RepID=A0A3G8YH34_9DEIO|nr:potassium transporter TrkG [Deinococcus psychrotolerans]AZI44265.1 potassium transporter TrkH [Deinococcus psychrotolerans]